MIVQPCSRINSEGEHLCRNIEHMGVYCLENNRRSEAACSPNMSQHTPRDGLGEVISLYVQYDELPMPLQVLSVSTYLGPG